MYTDQQVPQFQEDKLTTALCAILIVILFTLTALQFGFGGTIDVPVPEGEINLYLTPQNLCCDWDCELCPTEVVAMPTYPDVPGFVPATIAMFATRPDRPDVTRVATSFVNVTAPPPQADPLTTATQFVLTPTDPEVPTLPPTLTRKSPPKVDEDCWPMTPHECLPPLNIEFN